MQIYGYALSKAMVVYPALLLLLPVCLPVALVFVTHYRTRFAIDFTRVEPSPFMVGILHQLISIVKRIRTLLLPLRNGMVSSLLRLD